MTGEIKTSMVVNAIGTGLVTGWSAERLLAVATDRFFPDEARKSAIAELSVISLVDAVLLLSMMYLSFNTDPELASMVIPLFGSFGLSLSGFGYTRCARQVNPAE
jgi:hypothetical protein